MVTAESRVQLETAHNAAPSKFDAGFEQRWDAWVARGRVHEQRARRKFIAGAGLFAAAAAVVYALLRA